MKKAVLFCGVSASVLFSAMAAQAQEVPPTESASAGSTMDIVVTAQRREQRLQDVPVAVTAVSSDSLAKANITSAIDIGKIASGVIFQPNATAVTTFIRGMGNNQTTIGNEASNALYIDGVYQSRISPTMLKLNNIERIEVLKGPQGTLFGRNATGGLINIVTSDPAPGDPVRMNGMIGYGNYNTVEAGFYGSASLSEKLAASISGIFTNQGDGWGTNHFTGQDTFQTDELAIRGKLVFEASDRTRFILSGDYNKADVTSIGAPGRFVGKKPTQTGLFDGSGVVPDLPSRYDTNVNVHDREDTKGYGGHLRVEHELDALTIVNTVAYHKEINWFRADLDQTPENRFQFLGDGAYSRQISEELQFLSRQGSPIDWTVGLFYLDQKFGYPKSTPALLTGDAFGGGGIMVRDGGRNTSYALYGQTSFDIAPKLRGTIGLRYSYDETSAFGEADVFVPGGAIVVDAPRGTARATYSKLTWRAALDYKPTDELLIYASASRGTKAGGFALTTFDPTPIRPETLDAYEVGFKAELFDRRARLSGALFYYDFKDPQVQVQADSGVTRLINAGGAEVKGAEIDAVFQLTPDLLLRGSATFLDATYTDYPNAPFFTPNPLPPFGYLPSVPSDARGNRLTRAPKFSANAGFTYSIPVNDGDKIELGANYAWTGKFYWNPDNRVSQPGYGLLDAQIGYSFREDSLKLEIWGSNLTKEKYNVAEQQFGNFIGVAGNPGAPRTYGVRLRFKYN